MRRANAGWLGLFILIGAMVIAIAPTAALGQAQSGVKPEALAGSFKGTAMTPDGEMPVSVTLKYENGAFAGTVEHPAGPAAQIIGGTLTGDQLVLKGDMGGAPLTITCTIKDPDRVDGTWSLHDQTGKITLARVGTDAATPAGGAATGKPAAGANDPISGQWDGMSNTTDMSVPFTMTLKLDGEKVTGEISSEQGGGPLTGTWKDGTLRLSFELSGMGTVSIVGAMQEAKLVGNLDVGGQMQMQWAAVKKGSW